MIDRSHANTRGRLPVSGDLHLHSNASDGTRTPAEVIAEAVSRGLAYVALTDHDTVAGIAAAAAEVKRLQDAGMAVPVFIPGVELSVHFDGQEIHLLAYFPAGDLGRMTTFLDMQRRARVRRNLEMLAKLEQLGYYISAKDIPASRDPARSWGRHHMGRVLVEKGYFKHTGEAFSALLNPGRPAYVARQRVLLADALGVIHASGGMAVVAHPQKYGWCPETDTNIVSPLLLQKCKTLKRAGVDGIEAGHGDASDGQRSQMLAAALAFNLQFTQGSDDHGAATPRRSMYDGQTVLFPEKHAVVVCALIQNSANEYLLGRRAPTEALAGYYELPGGKVDTGESNEDALRREIKEELNLDAAIGDLRAVLFNETAGAFLSLAVYNTHLKGGQPERAVHDEFIWLTAADAVQTNLLPADRAFFRQLSGLQP